MKRLWGRKVSDLAYAELVSILEYVAHASGKEVIKIDRFAPSTKVCSKCGTFHPLSLKDREWTCPHCVKESAESVKLQTAFSEGRR